MTGDGFLWLKAVHVIAIISWMAGLLYLPRLFVYHTEVQPGSEASEKFKVMERRLLKAIMNPAAILSWGLGLWMAVSGNLFQAGWFHAKLLLVIFMSVSHVMMIGYKNAFAADRNSKSQKFFRVLNEVPTLLMIGIVLLVIVKPF